MKKCLFKELFILIRTVRIYGVGATSLAFLPRPLAPRVMQAPLQVCVAKTHDPSGPVPRIGRCLLPRRRLLVFLPLSPPLAYVAEASFQVEVVQS